MVRIGKIVATHGLQGAVILTHVTGRQDWLKQGDALFLTLRRDSRIPFFIENVRWTGDDEAIVGLEDVPDVEAAKKLIGKEAFVQELQIAAAGSDSPLLLIGFNVVDKTAGSLGPIEDVYQAGPQWLAQVRIGEKEVLLPLVDAFIVEKNLRNKYLRMDLPEGLLDL